MVSNAVKFRRISLLVLCVVSLTTGVLAVILKGYPSIRTFYVCSYYGLNALFIFMWFHYDAIARHYKTSMVLQIGVIVLPFVALPVYFFRSRGFIGGFKAFSKMALFCTLLGAFSFVGGTGMTVIMAKQGDASSQTDLGITYLRGFGVRQDYGKALEWFRKAAEQDFPATQYLLGLMYTNGWGVPKDYMEALNWYLKAAEKGDVNAQQNIGLMYSKGLGVRRDYAEALKWFSGGTKLGENGCPNCLAWLLATCPDDEIRDGPRAVLIAEKVVAKKPSFQNLDTLAAAYAEVGRYQDAIQTQKKALLRIKKNTPSFEKYQERLETYQSGRPWRDY